MLHSSLTLTLYRIRILGMSYITVSCMNMINENNADKLKDVTLLFVLQRWLRDPKRAHILT